MPEFDISIWDILVVVVYVAGTRIFFGWLSAKRGGGRDSEGYFLAGRSMRWPIIGLSFYVANMSGSSFVGLPGSAYNDGIAVFHYEWIPAFVLVFYVGFILPGVMATALYPDLENPDLAFSVLAFDLLPVGLRGLILAALTAAILSSLEAILNSASTLFTMDFVKSLRPRTSEKALVRVGRCATLVFMALSAAWAPQITKFPTLWQYLQSILSYVTPPVVAVFLLGIFWRRGTRWGALATLVGGILLGAICWILVEVLGVFKIQYLYACGLMLLLSCVLHVAVSLATKPPPEEKLEKTTWRAEVWTRDSEQLRGRPWHTNYRVLSVGLMAITAAIVVWWW